MGRIGEIIEEFLVSLGLALSRLSPEETSMVTLLLAFLLVAMAMSRFLALAHS
ncbi:MAG: hypothetical protein M3O31_01040 [Acidobacteriota bacterium]|nr:hypothetical protein [Acidobacteriota bacterium]